MTSAAQRLLAWLETPATGRGIYFRVSRGWDHWSYARIAERALQIAGRLRQLGIGSGATVALLQRSSPDFVCGLFGSLAAGATPTPLPPPSSFGDPAQYRERLGAALSCVSAALVIADPSLSAALSEVKGAPTIVTAEALACAGAASCAASRVGAASAGALIQFTSGSSGAPRAVRLSLQALGANVSAIQHWLSWTEKDAIATWLPLYHDMGLIGCFITPVTLQADVWLYEPKHFVRDPASFLQHFSGSGARLTAMPSFGLEHVLQRVRPERLVGLDFSGWRGLIVGAERVRAATLEQFHALLAPHGFRRSALLPAYGLAEATLAVTGLALEEGWQELRLDASSIVPGRGIRPLAADADGTRVTRVVGCGRPLAGVEIDIVGPEGAALPEGSIGEVRVRRGAVATGYVGELVDAQTRFSQEGLRTGDLGFVLAQQLFVCGREGDGFKLRGRWVFAEDVEAALVALGVPSARVAVLLGERDVGRQVAVLLESEVAVTRAAVVATVRELVDGAEVDVIAVPRRTIARTSSGKVRRRVLWRAYLAGELGTAPAGQAAAALASPTRPGDALRV